MILLSGLRLLGGRPLRVLLALALVAPAALAPVPAHAFAPVQTVSELIQYATKSPAGLARSITAQITGVTGQTIAADGAITRAAAGTAVRFVPTAVASSAGAALTAAAVSTYVGYSVGMWAMSGYAPWEAPSTDFSAAPGSGSIYPKTWCFGTQTAVNVLAPVPATCSNTAAVYYLAHTDGSWKASATIYTPWRVANPTAALPDPSLSAAYPGAFSSATGSYRFGVQYYCNGVPQAWSTLSPGSDWGSTFLKPNTNSAPYNTACPAGTATAITDPSKQISMVVFATRAYTFAGPSTLTDAATGKKYVDWNAFCSSNQVLTATEPGCVVAIFGPTPTSNVAANPVPVPRWTPSYSLWATGLKDTATPVLAHLELETTCKGSAPTLWKSADFAQYNDRPDFPRTVCPDGVLMLSQTGRVVWADGRSTTLFTYVAPTVLTNPTGEFAACLGANLGTCKLSVVKVFPSGEVASCDGSPSPCLGWWSDPAATTNYRCMWGSYRLALSECEALKGAYETTPTYAAPSAGSTTISTDTAAPPSPQPGTDPWPSATPGLGDGCLPSGWDVLNPYSLAKSVACVLKWAFVPTQTAAQFASLRAEFVSRPPGSVANAVLVAASSIATGWSDQSCSGFLPYNFSTVQGVDGRLPCRPPGGAAWETVYLMMTLFVAGSVLWSLWGFITSAFGAKED